MLATSNPRRDEGKDHLEQWSKKQPFSVEATESIDVSELSFRLADAHPELRRLLHIHIPKTGGTSLDAILCARRETLPVPVFPEYLPTILRELMGQEPVEDQAPAQLLSQYFSLKDRLLAQGKLRWLLPVTHIRLAEAIGHTRDHRDVRFTLLRHPREQVVSMLRFRIMHTLHKPDCIIHRAIHQILGMTRDAFLSRAQASDPELFRMILRLDTEVARNLGFSSWLCLPGQPHTSEQMLASIATHGIHCATAATMTRMVHRLTGLTDPSAPSLHRNRTDDLNHSGLRLHIDDSVITPFVEESSVELFARLQEADALAVWADPTSSTNDYWRCIDRAVKVQAKNASAFRPLGKDAVPLSPSLARLRLLQEQCQRAVTLEQALIDQRRQRDMVVRSRIWRATAPYRRLRHRLAQLRRRLSQAGA